jgi:alkaline phosphatase D
MMGTEQERWLLQRLDESPARWNVIAQQVMMAQFDFDPRPRTGMFNMDQWDGYVAARNRLVSFLQQRQPANPVVITGDIHSSWVNDLKADFNNPDSATVGTEFVGTSLSSAFPADYVPVVKLARLANPHNKFFEGTTHGYVRCQITREGWQSDYRVVSSILEPDAAIKTMASFLVEHGKPGAQRL